MVSIGVRLALLFHFHRRTADKWKYHRESSSGPLCRRPCRYSIGTWAPCCLAFALQCPNIDTQHMILHCWSLTASDRSACWCYSAPQPGSYPSRSCWKAKSANLISNNNNKNSLGEILQLQSFQATCSFWNVMSSRSCSDSRAYKTLCWYLQEADLPQNIKSLTATDSPSLHAQFAFPVSIKEPSLYTCRESIF